MVAAMVSDSLLWGLRPLARLKGRLTWAFPSFYSLPVDDGAAESFVQHLDYFGVELEIALAASCRHPGGQVDLELSRKPRGHRRPPASIISEPVLT
jgi:hypothetical protein